MLRNRRIIKAYKSLYMATVKVATNALKHLMDQLEERILQTNQLKNTSKRL